MVRPKKHLGQHFLIDKNIARKITFCLNEDNPLICELGPGTGVLTRFLLERSTLASLNLIEIDTESVEYLQANFSDPRLNILERDFLKMDMTEVFDKPFALIGNFPYNISSQIFFKVLENRNLIPEVVGMIQKEVAERIAARPGSKTYGILSVLLQAWYNINYCFTVPEHVFLPPPKVKSAVVKLLRNDVDQLNCDEGFFFRVVKTAFGQRRKTLRNALKPLTGNIASEHRLLNKRAEQLSIDDFVALTQFIQGLVV